MRNAKQKKKRKTKSEEKMKKKPNIETTQEKSKTEK
jgi:hypothetical protein